MEMLLLQRETAEKGNGQILLPRVHSTSSWEGLKKHLGL